MDNRCICCGDIIPEGRSFCCSCSLESVDFLMRENDDLIAALQERDTTIAMLKDAHASELAYRKHVAAIEKREMEEQIERLTAERNHMVSVETVKKWLYAIAINNVGCVLDGDFSVACEEIISRLDGLERFAEEMKEEQK